MAAPTVRGRTTPEGYDTSTTSPASTAIGDLVVVITWQLAASGTTPPTFTLQSGYTEVINQTDVNSGTAARLAVAWIVATAAGAQTYQAYTSTGGGNCFMVTVVIIAGTYATDLITGASTFSASSGAPDPPNLTLDVNRDWLVLPVGGWVLTAATNCTVTVMANYSNLNQSASTSENLELATAERALTAPASENPAAFGDNISPLGTATATIGIPSPVLTSLPIINMARTRT